MEDRLPQGCNLLKQIELEGGGPCTVTHPESMEEVVVGDVGGEVVIKNHRHRLPDHLHEAYVTIVPPPFWYRDHRMPGLLLWYYSVAELYLN